MSDSFNQVLKNLQLDSALPFGLELTFEPMTGYPTETVAGIEIPVMNDLTAGEELFFGKLEEAKRMTASEFQTLIRILSEKLRRVMNVESIAEAAKYVILPKEDWVDDSNYIQFTIDNQSDLAKLITLYNLMDKDTGMDILMITFFLRSRVDSEWSVARTANLGVTKALPAIKAFIVKEANGGMVESDDEVTGDETEGK